ncbi:hypothetical protein SAMCFNEI73_pC1707 (plasmid) [Sinorhizobium americanum]|uniref:Uncharacterized protein n=1 Tax=Sinorhizobium americanum TaxID=194963 RepID=A0A1L3LZB4_9HYPH|nr:hypothetical protein SAMCFNEI73_pC1707 [Sinorhizobium americanum]
MTTAPSLARYRAERGRVAIMTLATAATTMAATASLSVRPATPTAAARPMPVTAAMRSALALVSAWVPVSDPVMAAAAVPLRMAERPALPAAGLEPAERQPVALVTAALPSRVHGLAMPLPVAV